MPEPDKVKVDLWTEDLLKKHYFNVFTYTKGKTSFVCPKYYYLSIIAQTDMDIDKIQ